MATRVFTQTFGVVGAILERDGKILLIKERGGTESGMWNQPAGWIDLGEHPIDAVKREVKEETGFDFKPTALLGIYSIVKTHLSDGDAIPHGIKLIFIGDILVAENARSNEILEQKWFSPAEINSMDARTLRDVDIKLEVKDYFAGISYPLDIIRHTVTDTP